MLKGRLIRGSNGLYSVMGAEGDIVFCRASSKLRKDKAAKLLAGDWVIYTPNPDGSGFITGINDRKNSFVRPAAANIDVLVAVVSVIDPLPYPYNIDKLTASAARAGAEVCLVFTKTDLASADGLLEIYRKTPFLLLLSDINGPAEPEKLKSFLKGKTAVLAGASGAGKSSLINSLYPELDTEVGEISERIKRGKNTTRVTELFCVGERTFIADSPGFGLVDFEPGEQFESPEQAADCFWDFIPFLGGCRYTDCSHTVEDGCALLGALRDGKISPSRHESYKKLRAELRENMKNRY